MGAGWNTKDKMEEVKQHALDMLVDTIYAYQVLGYAPWKNMTGPRIDRYARILLRIRGQSPKDYWSYKQALTDVTARASGRTDA